MRAGSIARTPIGAGLAHLLKMAKKKKKAKTAEQDCWIVEVGRASRCNGRTSIWAKPPIY